MEPGEQVLWGLTDESPESEVLEKAFSLIGAIRFIPAATTNEQGGAERRILDFNRLSDGQLYFMTSRGKPTYRQMRHQPRLRYLPGKLRGAGHPSGAGRQIFHPLYGL